MLIKTAAEKLDKAKMIRFVQHTGNLHSTDLGRTASHYYIKYASIEIFNNLLKPYMNEGQALAMVSKSEEFEQVKVRSLPMSSFCSPETALLYQTNLLYTCNVVLCILTLCSSFAHITMCMVCDFVVFINTGEGGRDIGA